MPKDDVLDVLSRLVDKSLVMAPITGETRVSQLQTLWQYGTDRLDDSDEADMYREACGLLPPVRRTRQRTPTRHHSVGVAGPSDPELANLKVALDWHLDNGDIDAALLMVSGMAWLWFVNSDFAEGTRWLASALEAEGKRRPELHAAAQVWHGYFVGISSSPASGVVECDQAIVVLRPGIDRVRFAEALLLGATVLIHASNSVGP